MQVNVTKRIDTPMANATALSSSALTAALSQIGAP